MIELTRRRPVLGAFLAVAAVLSVPVLAVAAVVLWLKGKLYGEPVDFELELDEISPGPRSAP